MCNKFSFSLYTDHGIKQMKNTVLQKKISKWYNCQMCRTNLILVSTQITVSKKWKNPDNYTCGKSLITLGNAFYSTSLEPFHSTFLYVLFLPHWEWSFYWIGSFSPFCSWSETMTDSSDAATISAIFWHYYPGSSFKGLIQWIVSVYFLF